ncbi:MAG: hypothetical protein ACLFQL_04640 [Paracoccaceae bacterium]
MPAVRVCSVSRDSRGEPPGQIAACRCAEIPLAELLLRLGRELELLHRLAEHVDTAIGNRSCGHLRLSRDGDLREALQNADLLRQSAEDLAVFMAHLASQIAHDSIVSLDPEAAPLKLAAIADRLHGRPVEGAEAGDVQLF